MALVDYGSDSHSDEDSDHRAAPPQPPSSHPSSTTLSCPLPPPKRSKPSKTRIFIDLPNPSLSSSSDHPASASALPKRQSSDLALDPPSNLESKKPKLGLSAKKSSGLASILPPPKRQQPPPPSKPPPTSQVRPPGTLPSPTDGHQASAAAGPSEPSTSSNSTASAPSGGLNLFGLSATPPAVQARPISGPPAAPSISISSAPQVSDEMPPPPTLLDPYPGYWQRANGQWCPRDPDEPGWRAFCATHYGAGRSGNAPGTDALPKDFFKDAPGGGSGAMKEFDAAKVARLAWESKPKVIDPREEARKEQAAAAAAKPAKQISARARGRHQLSSLLTEAQANRAELEDRISRGKFNRKAGGAKYGF